MNSLYWDNDQPDRENDETPEELLDEDGGNKAELNSESRSEAEAVAADGGGKDPAEFYQDKTDEEVVALCHQGDDLAEEYLLDKYKNFVRAKARSYFLIGADHEDIVQEGMIGLYKAIRDYRPEKLSSFHAFAELCVTRQMITAIKTATRQKHIPLNSYISLNKPLFDEESERTLLDVLMEGSVSNPEEILINREDLVNIHEKINEVLSGLEQDVLNAYLDGLSYQEIAEELGRHVKSIDNALQRVKRKLERYLFKTNGTAEGDSSQESEQESDQESDQEPGQEPDPGIDQEPGQEPDPEIDHESEQKSAQEQDQELNQDSSQEPDQKS